MAWSPTSPSCTERSTTHIPAQDRKREQWVQNHRHVCRSLRISSGSAFTEARCLGWQRTVSLVVSCKCVFGVCALRAARCEKSQNERGPWRTGKVRTKRKTTSTGPRTKYYYEPFDCDLRYSLHLYRKRGSVQAATVVVRRAGGDADGADAQRNAQTSM